MKTCHTATCLIKTTKAMIYFGDMHSRIPKLRYVVSLGARYDVPSISVSGDVPDTVRNIIEQYNPRPGIIYVEWPDGESPVVDVELFPSLLYEMEGNILVHCMGGHGRTGTLAAYLLHSMCKDPDPIKTVRRNYCKNAIETRTQLDFLESVGIPIRKHKAARETMFNSLPGVTTTHTKWDDRDQYLGRRWFDK